jgi:hypothetical protein
MKDNRPTTAIGTMMLMPSTKDEVQRFSELLIGSVEAGEVTPLQLKVMMKALSSCFDETEKRLKSYYMNEADKYPERIIELHGAKIEKAELGTKYNFSGCNDSELKDLEDQKKAIDEKIKERQTFLKAVKNSLTIVSTTTGEIETVYPPVKESTSGIKITLL